jgi:16S rRNA (guanine1207-N2)-methyltransferase
LRERAAGIALVLLDVLEEEPPPAILLAGEETGQVAARLAESGSEVAEWRRHVVGRTPATPWPPDGSWPCAALRLPRGTEAIRMALHALAARTAPGGRMLLAGGNDEGIRSAGGALEEVAEDVRTVHTRKHCRVWSGRRRQGVPVRGALEDWATEVQLELPSGVETLHSFPGLFAHGRLDPGTKLLLETLPAPWKGQRILDYGCGGGVVMRALASQAAGLVLHGLDRDTVALEAARRNVPEAELTPASSLEGLPEGLPFDAIVSNPPLHDGRAEDRGVVRHLVEAGSAHLRENGSLWLVTQRTVPVARLAEEHYAEIGIVGETRSFRVWRLAGAEAAARTGTRRPMRGVSRRGGRRGSA